MFQFKDVTVKVNNKVILKNFNLDIQSGDKVLIAGKSGIGKSTVVNLLLGFRKPDSGKIYFRNDKISKKVLAIIRKNVGYVSQDFDIGDGPVLDFIQSIYTYKANQNLGFEEKRIFSTYL